MLFFSTGRFDFHIELHALTVPQRKALLKHQVEEHELQCSEEVLSDIASKCEGYDAYDLVMLTFFLLNWWEINADFYHTFVS